MTLRTVFSFRQTWRHFSNKSWAKTVLQYGWHVPVQLDFFFWLFIRCHDTRNICYSEFFSGLFNMYPFNTIKKWNINYDNLSSGCSRWASCSCFIHLWPTNVECSTGRAWFDKTEMQICHQKLDFVPVKQRGRFDAVANDPRGAKTRSGLFNVGSSESSCTATMTRMPIFPLL